MEQDRNLKMQRARERMLKPQRRILNDIHKRIMAVSKGLQKPAQ